MKSDTIYHHYQQMLKYSVKLPKVTKLKLNLINLLKVYKENQLSPLNIWQESWEEYFVGRT